MKCKAQSDQGGSLKTSSVKLHSASMASFASCAHPKTSSQASSQVVSENKSSLRNSISKASQKVTSNKYDSRASTQKDSRFKAISVHEHLYLTKKKI